MVMVRYIASARGCPGAGQIETDSQGDFWVRQWWGGWKRLDQLADQDPGDEDDGAACLSVETLRSLDILYEARQPARSRPFCCSRYEWGDGTHDLACHLSPKTGATP